MQDKNLKPKKLKDQKITVDKNTSLEQTFVESNLDIEILLREGATYKAMILAKDSVNVMIQHVGENTKADITIIALAKDSEELSIYSHANHFCSHQENKQTIRTIADDASTVRIIGKINIEEGVEKIQSDLDNKNLQLTSKARVFTQPVLTIASDDVKCSHGATVGKLDENQLFYLMSRGLTEEQAKNLLQKAFIQEVLNAEDNLELKQPILDAINYE